MVTAGRKAASAQCSRYAGRPMDVVKDILDIILLKSVIVAPVCGTVMHIEYVDRDIWSIHLWS